MRTLPCQWLPNDQNIVTPSSTGPPSPPCERRAALRDHGGSAGAGYDPFQQTEQFLGIGGPVEGVVPRDLAAQDQVQQGLVHRLHAEFLTGLHGGVDLMDLLLADQVPD